jgi:murein DD-endopeptidase MepM/ murein hydrolase activator NlpD
MLESMTTAVAHLLSLLLTTTIPLVEIPTTETSHTGVWPLNPRPAVAAGFDPPLTTYGTGHRGVDLVGSPGQEVRASVGGRITYAGSLAGRGVVVVSHGSTRTTYEPVSAAVQVGAVLTAGEVIGTLQTFGSHCSPRACLHWGLIEGKTYLDPLTLVGSGPARLLPMFGPFEVSSRPMGGLDVRRRLVTHVGVPGGTPSADGRW